MNHILIFKCNPNYKREPRDVAIVDESTAAFSMWNSQIVILDLGVSLSVREISKLTGDCWRIADKNMNHILILKCNPNYKREPGDVAIVDESTAAFSMWNSQIVILDLGYRSQLICERNQQN